MLAGVEVRISKKDEVNRLVSSYTDTADNTWLRTTTPSSTDINSIQGDLNKAFNTVSAVKGGIKYVETTRSNSVLSENYDGQYLLKNPTASNEFEYSEKLFMSYGTYETSFDKVSVKAGMRGEDTRSTGRSITTNETITRNYFGLFPSLYINYAFNEKKGNSGHLNYSRRVKRPGYNDLNPYRLQVHDYTIVTGNPDLLPQFTHSVEAGYTFKQSYTADIYFQSLKISLPRRRVPLFDYKKLLKVTQWMYLAGRKLADNSNRPSVDPGFKLER